MGEDVTLAQLRMLSAFSTEASISGVARQLGVSQPTVSQSLSALERQIGRKLVDRTPGGSALTTDGRIVVELGQGLLREADRLLEYFDNTSLQQRGRLRIAASMTIAEYLFPYWLVAMGKSGVGLNEVELRVANSEQVMEMVDSRKVDAGFIEGHHLRPGLKSITIGEDRLAVVVRADHPWGREQRVTLDQFLSGHLLVREAGSGTREVLEQALESLGHQIPRSVVTMGSTSSIKTGVRAGDGVGVVSALAVRDELASGFLKEVPVVGLEMRRALRMVKRRGGSEDQRLAVLERVARAKI